MRESAAAIDNRLLVGQIADATHETHHTCDVIDFLGGQLILVEVDIEARFKLLLDMALGNSCKENHVWSAWHNASWISRQCY